MCLDKISAACKAISDKTAQSTTRARKLSMGSTKKKRSLKDVMRKFSRFSIVQNDAGHQSLPTHPKGHNQDCWAKPSKGADVLAVSGTSTVDEEDSMSAWSGAVDELLMSRRYTTLDEGSARFTIPEYDAPLQLPMRQLSKSSMCSCVLESSNRTEASGFSKCSFDDSIRSVGIDSSARSISTRSP